MPRLPIRDTESAPLAHAPAVPVRGGMMDLDDAALRERAEKALTRIHAEGDGCSIPWHYLVIDDVTAAMIAVRDASRAEQREADARIVCALCRGDIVRCRSGVMEAATFSSGRWWHIERGGALNGEDLWWPCDATAIRAQGGEK